MPRPARSVRARLAPVLVAGVLLLVTACGDTVAPDRWAASVCAAVTPWRARITELNRQAQQQMAGATTPTQTRDNLLTLLTGGQDASETARAAVAGAGVPDVDGGAQVAQRFVDTLARARDAYAHARTDLQALPVADASTFYDGVVDVLARLQTEYAASGIDTSNLDSPELRQAFDGAAQCR